MFEGSRFFLAGLILLLLAPAAIQARALPGLTERGSYNPLARPANIPSDAELEQSDAVIGKITVKVNNIFDTSRPEENAALFRLGNRLHIKTREDTVRDRLLFKPGERYSGRVLDETERLLRNTSFLD
ncbi:MAG TPA: hypothetical protein ENJ35_10755, partial [Gammaproteobacteria bacterium]|nr:hypothetical protein [Gammaproteobacteria bacterium]